MSDTKVRKTHSPDLKAKVAFEAIREKKTVNEIGMEYGVHPGQVAIWKRELLTKGVSVFEGKRGPKPVADHCQPELLYSEIGRLKVELDWLKKKSGIGLS